MTFYVTFTFPCKLSLCRVLAVLIFGVINIVFTVNIVKKLQDKKLYPLIMSIKLYQPPRKADKINIKLICAVCVSCLMNCSCLCLHCFNSSET